LSNSTLAFCASLRAAPVTTTVDSWVSSAWARPKLVAVSSATPLDTKARYEPLGLRPDVEPMDEAPERYEKMRSLYSYSRARRGLSSYRAKGKTP